MRKVLFALFAVLLLNGATSVGTQYSVQAPNNSVIAIVEDDIVFIAIVEDEIVFVASIVEDDVVL